MFVININNPNIELIYTQQLRDLNVLCLWISKGIRMVKRLSEIDLWWNNKKNPLHYLRNGYFSPEQTCSSICYCCCCLHDMDSLMLMLMCSCACLCKTMHWTWISLNSSPGFVEQTSWHDVNFIDFVPHGTMDIVSFMLSHCCVCAKSLQIKF